MLKPPKLGGAEQLRAIVDELSFDRACAAVDVSPATMRRWLSGKTPVPQAPLQALWWLTSWGFSTACSEAHWSHQYLVFKVRDLEKALAWQTDAVVAANEPMFKEPPAARVRRWWPLNRKSDF